ncbi:DUF7285 family protein [Natrarchaeobius chitinivorans]|uniref:Uncharacterized protein n=1 Tax=Natrarchaeobius chitinivorans TaxID=1679083 RepID=A0A3N6M012_NATCH|nr:hypothetical protein [Natrarchaeobius chitinivorans]RQG96543.1 hypothetical protein EA473_05370 [Natrarchaeobius chitinivorans]
MLRSSSRNSGQTEPLAALVAIGLVCTGVVLYTGVLATLYPSTTASDPADATLEQVWNAVGSDGVYHETIDRSDLHEGVELPDGYTVVIEVTTVTDEGRTIVVDSALVREDGSIQYDRSDVERPETTGTASRSVGVQLEADPAGDVRGGTLHVEVWR